MGEARFGEVAMLELMVARKNEQLDYLVNENTELRKRLHLAEARVAELEAEEEADA